MQQTQETSLVARADCMHQVSVSGTLQYTARLRSAAQPRPYPWKAPAVGLHIRGIPELAAWPTANHHLFDEVTQLGCERVPEAAHEVSIAFHGGASLSAPACLLLVAPESGHSAPDDVQGIQVLVKLWREHLTLTKRARGASSAKTEMHSGFLRPRLEPRGRSVKKMSGSISPACMHANMLTSWSCGAACTSRTVRHLVVSQLTRVHV